jgi:hypothetical protein
MSKTICSSVFPFRELGTVTGGPCLTSFAGSSLIADSVVVDGAWPVCWAVGGAVKENDGFGASAVAVVAAPPKLKGAGGVVEGFSEAGKSSDAAVVDAGGAGAVGALKENSGCC